LARIVSRIQTDFRDIDISAAWEFRLTVEGGTGGGFSYLGQNYQSAYIVEYLQEDFNQGYVKFYGSGLVKNGANILTGGVIQAMELAFTEGSTTIIQGAFTGLSINAVTVHDAMRTTSLADDRAVLRQMLNGDDRISLSNRGDFVYGGNGGDTIYGLKGFDTLNGDAGSDALYGGDGLDSVFGNEGTDSVFGGNGSDFLQGGKQDDTVTGGAGVDVFSFRTGDGNDRVLDWIDGVDELRFYGPEGAINVSFQNLAGGDVRISVLGMQIVVENAQLDDFSLISGSNYITLV
jgi:Ca2+-binding RTX toxin-like protein